MPPVRIDLSFPRIAADIRARHELLYQEARALIDSDLNPNEVYDDPFGLLDTVEAYFLLSEARDESNSSSLRPPAPRWFA